MTAGVASSVPVSLGLEFAQRAALYRQWDRALCESTRFYEAAALINAVFAESLSTPLGWLLSGGTVEFFGSLSRALLAFNATLAATLVQSNAAGGQLDASMVHAEQGIVQRQLAELHRREHRAYARLVREANGLLVLVQTLALVSVDFPNTTVLGTVLRQLQGARGRRVDFANCSDREAVGNALIVAARRNAAGNQGRSAL